jgi:hypothetical protein
MTQRIPRVRLASTLLFAALAAGSARAQEPPEFPPFEEVVKGFEKVVSTADGKRSLYTIYKRDKDAQMLAELPADFASQKIFIHNVVAGGSPLAGVGILMSGERYVYWERIGKKLALMEPELTARSSGGIEDKKSHEIMFTDRVILSTPIVTMAPGGGPVIDLDALLVGRSSVFFGRMTAGADATLARIKKAKAFPQNVELAFELPLATSSTGTPMFGLDAVPSAAGRMTELHYSISLVPQNTGYEPRAADPRVGYFMTSFNDMSKTTSGPETWVRYITRWRIEKADPSLRLSPPKKPLVWYIEHTTPIRYRRYIREGILEWNRAFERIGIVDAVEARQQDSRTGAYMDIDPEDVRYNFVRWNNNQAAFAIGPSRANPVTGEIFDADVTINAGILASFANGFRALMPAIAVEGFSAETMAWLDEHPDWDPRVRLAPRGERQRILAQRAAHGPADYPAGYVAGLGSELSAQVEEIGLQLDSQASSCMAGAYAALGTGLMRLVLSVEEAGEEGEEGQAAEDLIDGLPEEYVGQLLRWLTIHETGHCLGLRHNFAASTIYDLAEVNSASFPSDEATGGSVMEYTPPNINHELGEVQGQYVIQNVGPYDFWAIEYGYTPEKDLKPILARCSDPKHVYGDNNDMVGPDPRVRTYDFGKNPLEFCRSRMGLVQELRSKILDEIVDEGEGWGEARRAFNSLLSQQVSALSIAANWVGGTYVNKDFKGDPGNRPPLEDIPVERQRAALNFVIANSFDEKAFGLTPELLRHISIDRWGDLGDRATWDSDPAYPVHDLVVGVQSAALTMLMNPTTLRRVYDNEFRAEPGDDILDLPELFHTVVDAAFSELGSGVSEISSLRRNLQSEIVERLIDLSLARDGSNAVTRPLATLSRAKLREIHAAIQKLPGRGSRHEFTSLHLDDLAERIEHALDAQFVYRD